MLYSNNIQIIAYVVHRSDSALELGVFQYIYCLNPVDSRPVSGHGRESKLAEKPQKTAANSFEKPLSNPCLTSVTATESSKLAQQRADNPIKPVSDIRIVA